MADLKVNFTATENVSDEARKAAAGTDELAKSIDKSTTAAKKNEDATDGAGKSVDRLATFVTGANQALEIAGKVWSVASRAAGALTDFVKAGALEAMAAEKAQRQLTAALGGGTERITAMTSALQRRTGADADAMNQQAATLASMGLTTDQIERAIPALRAYAEVTGKDASRAVMTLGKAFEEGKVDERIASLSQFIPAADAATATFGGTVERLTRNLGELQEEIGSSVTESDKLKGALSVLDQTVLDLTGSVEGIGPLLGDGLAKGLELSADAAASAARGLSEMLQPTSAISGVLGQLVPNLQSARTGMLLFAPDTLNDSADGLRAVSSGLDDLADSLGRVNDEATDAAAADIDATLAKWAAKIAANEERAATQKAAAAERAKTRAKAARAEAEKDAKAAEEAADRAAAANLSAMDKASSDEALFLDSQLSAWQEADKAREAREEAAYLKKVEVFRRSAKIQDDETKAAAKASDDAAKAVQQNTLDIIGDVGSYASMGASAMQSFAAGMAAESTSDQVKGILSGVLQVAGGILGFVASGGNPAGLMAGAGAGGALGSLSSSLPFREGGPVQGYEIPKARRGAVVLGETDRDGRITETHSGEVVLSADAVSKNGGMARVGSQNRHGSAPLGGAGGSPVTINVVALDPATAVQVIERSVEPAQVSRMQSRQGAKWRKEIQRTARGPGNGGGR